MSPLSWRELERVAKGGQKPSLGSFPVGQAEFRALGSIYLVPNERTGVYCFKRGAGKWWR